MAWTAPRTWVTGELVTASIMNTHVRDNLLESATAKVTTAGDIVYATAANALSRLALGTAGKVMIAGASAPTWGVDTIGIRATNNTGLASGTGAGVEIGYDATNAFVQGYNRTAAAYIGLALSGMALSVTTNAIERLRIESTGAMSLAAPTSGVGITVLGGGIAVTGNGTYSGHLVLTTSSGSTSYAVAFGSAGDSVGVGQDVAIYKSGTRTLFISSYPTTGTGVAINIGTTGLTSSLRIYGTLQVDSTLAVTGTSTIPNLAANMIFNTYSGSTSYTLAFGSAGGTGDVALYKEGADTLIINSFPTVGTPVTVNIGVTGAATSALNVFGTIRTGTTPATTGALRLTNDSGIFGRNAANSANINLAYLNSGDALLYGATGVLDMYFDNGLGRTTYIRFNGVTSTTFGLNYLQIGANSGTADVRLTKTATNTLVFDSGPTGSTGINVNIGVTGVSTSIFTVFGLALSASGIRTTGNAALGNGSGAQAAEMYWDGTYAGFRGYSQSGASYQAVALAGSQVNFFIGTTRVWNFESPGHLICPTDNTYDIGASGATRPRTGYFGTSLVVNGMPIPFTTASAFASATTTLTSAATTYDIDSLSLSLAAGTWLIYLSAVTHSNSGTGAVGVQIYNSTDAAIVASGESWLEGANAQSVTVVGLLTIAGTKTIKGRAQANTTSMDIVKDTVYAGFTSATYILAVRIA